MLDSVAPAPADVKPKSHSVSFKVYYEDTDSLGMVYYANYFKFFERGRTEYLEASGKGPAAWNDEGIAFVVHQVKATFKRPAKLGDTIDIVSAFSLASPFKGVFTQQVQRNGETLVTATITLACTDAAGNLRRFPVELE